jgi:hypothetical protein
MTDVQPGQDRRNRSYAQMRSLLDYGMGAFYILVGTGFMLAKKMGYHFFDNQPLALTITLGAVFVIYGGWRIYRGYRKNYFNKDEA